MVHFLVPEAKTGSKIPRVLQARNLNRTVASQMRFYVTAIFPSPGLLKRLDAKMFSIISKNPYIAVASSSLSPSDHANRNRQVSALIEQRGGKWSKRWSKQHKTWVEHLARHPSSPATQILRKYKEHVEWLQVRRTFQFLTSSSSSLGTRRTAGRPLCWANEPDLNLLESLLVA
jgi:hypothetical protein